MGWFEEALSWGTGGVSDVFQGNPIGHQAQQGLRNRAGDSDLMNAAITALNPAFSQGERLKKSWDKGGDINSMFSMFEDIADPTGTVNPGLEWMGEAIPDSWRPVVGPIATTIGMVAGGPPFAALGAGIGTHLNKGSSQQAVTNALTSWIVSGALSGAKSAGGDALGGGLTGEEAQLAGPEYGYNAYGEGVGPVAQTGYPTGTEAQNFYSTDEFGQPVDQLTGEPVEGELQTNLDPFGEGGDATVNAAQNPPNQTWSEKAWEATKDIASKNVSKLGDIGKAISASGGELVAGGMTPSGGSSLYPWEEEARIRRLSSDPSKDKVMATNLELWKAGKLKATDYNAEVLARELANYKKKEEEQNVYI
jgi:hypothetical protein